MTVTILELYPSQLNLNGDTGNRRALSRRLELAGVAVEQLTYEPGETLPAAADIVLLGTGTSSAVRSISDDFARIAPTLKEWSESGVVFLAAGAGFHLLGNDVRVSSGQTLVGAGIFDMHVDATQARVITEGFGIRSEFGVLIGTENHTATVKLGASAVPLGTVLNGRGNGDGTEGAVMRQSFGTHCHGPVLILNPALADRLLELACTRTGDSYVVNADHETLDRVVDATRKILLKKLPSS
jgi:CobQ-like glutamine amidotransferase family enzyme